MKATIGTFIPAMFVGAAIALVVIGSIVFFSGCSGDRPPESKVAADAYGQELDACSETARDLAESVSCRIAVMNRWGRGDSGSKQRAEKTLSRLRAEDGGKIKSDASEGGAP